MPRKQIKNKHDLPSWFKLDNYDELNTIDDHELCYQVELRRYMLELIEEDKNGIAHYLQANSQEIDWEDGELFKQLFNSKVLLDYPSDMLVAPAQLPDDLKLFKTRSISGLNNMEVFLNTAELISENVIKFTNDNEMFFTGNAPYTDFSFINTWINQNEQNNTGIATVNIDLANYTNEEILFDLKSTLEIWRRQLDAPSPNHQIAKQLEIKNIKDNRIIPRLDLMVWEQLENKQIISSVLAVVLYPNGEKGEIYLKQTMPKHLKNMTNNSYRLLAESRKNKLKKYTKK